MLGSRVRRTLLATVVAGLAAIAGICAAAQAQPAQELSFRLTATSPDRPITFQFTLRSFDTTGVQLPLLTDYYVRLPLGATVRRQFLTPRYACDGPALRDALDARPSALDFQQQIANLKPFIRSLAHGRSRSDRAALANAEVCERSRIGGGSVLIDASRVTKVLSDPVPGRFSVFLSRGTAPGSIAGFAILGAAEESSPIVQRFPVLAGVHAALVGSVVDDPTPDGLYGYKLLLPTGRINGLDVTISQVTATLHGLTLAKGTCLKRDRRGRCARRQPRDLQSFALPHCPPSGQLSAQLFAAYGPSTPSITTTLAFPCPAYTQ